MAVPDNALRLAIKWALFPGLDVATRKRMRFARYFRSGQILTLDAGCGNGAFSFAAFRRGNRVLAIDNDGEKVRRCREFRDFLKVDPGRCQFREFDIYKVASFGDAVFDQIICFETLEHLERDQEVIDAFAKVLKQGGVLHLCTPTLLRRPYFGERISEVEDGGHVRLGYTAARLVEMLAKCGLEMVRTDRAVGFGSQRLLNLLNWASQVSFRDTTLGEAVCALLLICGYPLTLLDYVVPAEPLNIYIQAMKLAKS